MPFSNRDNEGNFAASREKCIYNNYDFTSRVISTFAILVQSMIEYDGIGTFLGHPRHPRFRRFIENEMLRTRKVSCN